MSSNRVLPHLGEKCRSGYLSDVAFSPTARYSGSLWKTGAKALIVNWRLLIWALNDIVSTNEIEALRFCGESKQNLNFSVSLTFCLFFPKNLWTFYKCILPGSSVPLLLWIIKQVWGYWTSTEIISYSAEILNPLPPSLSSSFVLSPPPSSLFSPNWNYFSTKLEFWGTLRMFH